MNLKRLTRLAKRQAEGAGIAAAIGPALLLLTGIGLIIIVVQTVLRPFARLRRLLGPDPQPLPVTKTHSHRHPRRSRPRGNRA